MLTCAAVLRVSAAGDAAAAAAFVAAAVAVNG